MDVTLGVSVTGSDVRIALIDADPPHAVIDESQVDLAELVSTLVATDRGLVDTGHRLVATRVCSSDAERAAALENALVDANLINVSVVSQPDAVSEVARSLTPGETVASLAADGDTAALSIVDADSDTTSLIAVEPIHGGDRLSAYRTLLERFSEEPGGATSVIVIGGPAADDGRSALAETSPIPLRFPDAPESALARGAAMAGLRQHAAGARTVDYPDSDANMAETVLSRHSEQLAYSQVGDAEDERSAAASVPMQTPMRPLSAVDPEELEADDTPVARPKALLLGSTVAALVVVGFAALAVSVAISIRPTVSEQAIRMQEEPLPGKYFPVSPGQGVNPDGENWTLVEKLPPQGEETGVRTFVTKPLSHSSGIAGPAKPTVIYEYIDKTVGVGELGPDGVPRPAPSVNVGLAVPEFVPRLIPDLSRVNMCQVMSFVSNMETIASRGLNNTMVTVSDVVDRNNGLSLDRIGKVAAVKPGQGALFSIEGASIEGAKSEAPGVSTIPKEIFETDKSAINTSQVLPPGTTLIEALPAPTDKGNPISTPILSEAIPELDTVVTPGAPESGGILRNGPQVGLPLPELGVDAPSPGGVAPVLEGPKIEGPEIGVVAPRPDVKMPAPEVDIPAPRFDPPAPPRPPISIPDPKPPVVDIPDPPARVSPPVVDLPDPPAPVSPPVVDIPDLPVVDLPDRPAPVSPRIIDIPLPQIDAPPAAPTVPARPRMPLLPKLPFGEKLFGSGEG